MVVSPPEGAAVIEVCDDSEMEVDVEVPGVVLRDVCGVTMLGGTAVFP
jgi:hypothetical protein